jgi:hypothetical protein
MSNILIQGLLYSDKAKCTQQHSGLAQLALIDRPTAEQEIRNSWGLDTGDPRSTYAGYLASIFNSETARSRTENLQSRGQWGACDFDKVIFNLGFQPPPRLAWREVVAAA